MATNVPVESTNGTTGVTLAPVAAVATMEFSNDGKVVALLLIGAAGAGNVTFTSRACSHGRTADKVLAVANNGKYAIGPFPPELWNDANGKVQLAFSVTTGNTIDAIKPS